MNTRFPATLALTLALAASGAQAATQAAAAQATNQASNQAAAVPGERLAANTDAKLQAGHEYMAVANYPNLLNVLDLGNNSVLKTCALPDAFGPGIVQISPDRKLAYLLNNRFGSIYGVELDSCKVVFKADMSWQPNERAKAIFSIAVSPDGKELYTVQNPTLLHRDRYEVQSPRLAVYDTAAGLDAKPARTFPAPRQITIMQTGDDGALYMVGADFYKVDVNTGEREVVIPMRDWGRPNYSPPDVLYAWPIQSPSRDFTILYTAAKFQDDKQDMETAEFKYGLMNVNLKTGKTEVADFAPVEELYFTGVRSPKDRNHIFGVLNGLRKYDIAAQKQIASADLEHAYYVATINRDGSRVYLSGTFNEVAVYNADDLKRLATIQLPGGDMSLGTAQVFVR